MLLLCVLGLVLMVGCSGNTSHESEILVFAASSLTDSFTDMAEKFEETSGTRVRLNFASSSTLATQILEGAPAAVYASANEAQMQRVLDAERADSSSVLATNRLVVVVPKGESPVMSFEDIAAPGVKLVLAASEVPVGAYAMQFVLKFDEANPGFQAAVTSNIVSEEPNVRAVLTKVQLGEADAGIVYETDAATASDDVRTFEIPDEFNVVARYPLAVIADSNLAGLSAAFIDFVMGEEGQAILESYGFGPPPLVQPGAAS